MIVFPFQPDFFKTREKFKSESSYKFLVFIVSEDASEPFVA